jgi:sterol desaturase/sphingolipid hydroxylase (fatty acid hydroxylase superfamily)
MDVLEMLPALSAALALALLWVGEAVAPLFAAGGAIGRGERWALRARHLVLAGLNAVVASVFAFATLAVTEWAASAGFGLLHAFRPGEGGSLWGAVGVGVGAVVLLDGWHYLFHVLAHKVPLLWRFHVMHHNADHMEATAAMRFHAAEIAVQSLLSLPVYALLGVTIFEVLVYQVILLPVALFHHADIRLPGWLERGLRVVIVTPGMHLLHHSRWERETDSNFSAVLSVWDRLFGSYRWRDDLRTVEVGIDGYGPEDVRTLRGMLRTGVSRAPYAPGRAPEAGDVPRELRRRDLERARRGRGGG